MFTNDFVSMARTADRATPLAKAGVLAMIQSLAVEGVCRDFARHVSDPWRLGPAGSHCRARGEAKWQEMRARQSSQRGGLTLLRALERLAGRRARIWFTWSKFRSWIGKARVEIPCGCELFRRHAAIVGRVSEIAPRGADIARLLRIGAKRPAAHRGRRGEVRTGGDDAVRCGALFDP
jgi:hypothetical protein